VYEVESDPKVMLSILLGPFSAAVLFFFSSCSAKTTLEKDAAAATWALGAFIGATSTLAMMIGKVGLGLVRRRCEDLVESRKVRRSREARQEVLVLCLFFHFRGFGSMLFEQFELHLLSSLNCILDQA
jgi:hypothetical protein